LFDIGDLARKEEGDEIANPGNIEFENVKSGLVLDVQGGNV